MIKTIYRRRLKVIIQNETKQKESDVDHNKIMEQIKIVYFFRVIKLVISCLILSYFLGTPWFVFTKRMTNPGDFTFYNYYSLEDNTSVENLVIVVYFAFTTLS